MVKGFRSFWRHVGVVERAFLVCILLYAILHFSGASLPVQLLAGVAAFGLGIASLFRVARLAMRRAIWRLRNRLIAAYYFIAVVPIVLIVALVGIAAWALIGQVAVYLVTTELSHREAALQRQAEFLARFPMRDDVAMSRFENALRNVFPDCQLRVTGSENLRYPTDTTLEQPPAEWKRTNGLITKKTPDKDRIDDRLYAWAHVVAENGNEVTIIAPISHDVLAGMVPGLGDVDFIPLLGHIRTSHVPAQSNWLDQRLSWGYYMYIPKWESPQEETRSLMYVTTRPSAVMSVIFGEKSGASDLALILLVSVAVLFLVVEMFSLLAGVQLSRSITGAVHELYEGTEHVKEGDFSYRIPVKGKDQLAELATSFNTMTSNLGRLLVVAKEKERLESELAIARDVQEQLFPKDVPFTKTLELKGVCHPARMVSGDYYDFLSLSDQTLAFAIGDVAGKGISAALLMATIQSTMRTQLSSLNGNARTSLSTASMVATLNRQLYATTAPEKYATFYFGIYQEQTHSLMYTNAGHLSPMLLHAGDVTTLDSTGTVVGAFPFARFQERVVPLDQGDMLVAYTDGIVEPENAYGEMFGEDRLKDLLIKYASADSSEIIAHVMEAVNQWTGSSELQDDMTMVVARRL
jgi:sigma-B regulation protein RsbU (phosphoserine phosphatase)